MTPPTPWEPLFDIALQGPPNTGWLAASAVVLALAGVALWRRQRRGQALAMPLFACVASALVLAATALSVWDHHRLVAALVAERFQLAEGPLLSHTVQHRATWNARTRRHDRSIAESFYVGAVAFGFVRDASVPGFTNSGREPLALVAGQTLRVHYVEDEPGQFASRRILRLERLRTPGGLGAAEPTNETNAPRREAAVKQALPTLAFSQR